MPRKSGSPSRLRTPKPPDRHAPLRGSMPQQMLQRMVELLRIDLTHTIYLPIVVRRDRAFGVPSWQTVNRIGSVDARAGASRVSETVLRDVQAIASRIALLSQADDFLNRFWPWLECLVSDPNFMKPHFGKLGDACALLHRLVDISHGSGSDEDWGTFQRIASSDLANMDKALAALAWLRSASVPSRAQVAWAVWAMLDWELGTVADQIAVVQELADASESTARAAREKFAADIAGILSTIQKQNRRMD